MGAVQAILERQGVAIAFLVFIALVIWRSGPTVKEWVSMLIKYFIEAGKARTEAMKELASILTAMRDLNEKMHSDQKEHVQKLAQENRHAVRNELQVVMGSIAESRDMIIGKLDESTERMERALRVETRTLKLLMGHADNLETEG